MNIKQIKDGKEDTPLLERPIPAAAATAACQKKLDGNSLAAKSATGVKKTRFFRATKDPKVVQ